MQMRNPSLPGRDLKRLNCLDAKSTTRWLDWLAEICTDIGRFVNIRCNSSALAESWTIWQDLLCDTLGYDGGR